MEFFIQNGIAFYLVGAIAWVAFNVDRKRKHELAKMQFRSKEASK